MSRFEPGVLAGGAVLAVIGGVAAFAAYDYGLWRQTAPGEGLYPFAVAAVVVALGLATIASSLATADAETRPAVSTDDASPTEAAPAWRKLGLYLLGVIALAILLEPLGYQLTAAASLIMILRFAEGLSWTMTLGVTVGTLAATYLVFERLLGLQLPGGVLF